MNIDNNSHWLGRPPNRADNVERWTGEEWIPDDWKPGLAFSGTVQTGVCAHVPYAWYSECDCNLSSRYGTQQKTCPANIAMTHTANRFRCANGQLMTRTISKD